MCSHDRDLIAGFEPVPAAKLAELCRQEGLPRDNDWMPENSGLLNSLLVTNLRADILSHLA